MSVLVAAMAAAAAVTMRCSRSCRSPGVRTPMPTSSSGRPTRASRSFIAAASALRCVP